jgi:uncharacterized protein YjiS (DUF1127 family)
MASLSIRSTAQTDKANVRQHLRALISKINLWHMRYRTRQELARFSDQMLQDIGVSRYDANQEADKPFWKE